MFHSDEIEKMLIEIETGKPHSMKGPEAEKMYLQLTAECEEIRRKGGSVLIPHEIPDPVIS